MNKNLGPVGQAILDAHTQRYPDGLVTTKEAAGILRLRPSYLETLRCKGGGPEYVRHARRVFYQLHTLVEWAESRMEIRQ